MGITTDANNVFRYVHFRPPRATDEITTAVKARSAQRPGPRGSGSHDENDRRARLRKLESALAELQSLDLARSTHFRHDSGPMSAGTQLVLNERGVADLGDDTKRLLGELGLDVSADHGVMVESVGSAMRQLEEGEPSFAPVDQPPSGYVQSVGTAHLLVLKQQIKRYEPAEIAHIENVVAGERKVRNHTNLTRIEEFSSSSSETTTDSDTELATTERFEMNKQAATTIQQDTELGLELSLSGKYGPTVSFESDFSAGQSTSTSDQDEKSVAFSKETVARAKERVVEKLSKEQSRTLVREITEVNEHTLENQSEEHRVAIYQYVDKIYESQVFDYGQRLMFDIMIPEPSSFLWYLKSREGLELDIAAPPSLEELGIQSPRDITRSNYAGLGTTYGVAELPPFPDIVVTRRLRLAHGTGGESDEGVHKSGVSGELRVPAGFRPLLARSTILATSDETFSFSLNIGGTVVHYQKDDFTEVSFGDSGHQRYSLTETAGHLIDQSVSPNSLAPDETLHVDLYGYESANYTFHIDVQFHALYDPAGPGYGIVQQWQQAVFDRLLDGYGNAKREHEQELSFRHAEASASNDRPGDLGASSAVNRKLINTELKKHCMAVFRDQHLGTLVTPHVGEPPQFLLAAARSDGEVIRFLEHAFEWSQLQFVCYPYYWARPQDDLSGWSDRVLERNSDFTMEDFLQAGYARVVIPVREGFDQAVSYFVTKGEPYNGLGEPPIEDPLYISIIDELKERAGAGKDEIPVGDPWETRLPTSAVMVRTSNDLPAWLKKPGTDWEWEVT